MRGKLGGVGVNSDEVLLGEIEPVDEGGEILSKAVESVVIDAPHNDIVRLNHDVEAVLIDELADVTAEFADPVVTAVLEGEQDVVGDAAVGVGHSTAHRVENRINLLNQADWVDFSDGDVADGIFGGHRLYLLPFLKFCQKEAGEA